MLWMWPLDENFIAENDLRRADSLATLLYILSFGRTSTGAGVVPVDDHSSTFL